MTHRACHLLLAACMFVTGVHHAFAQALTQDDEARRAFSEGVQLASAAKWPDAEHAFARSAELKPIAATWMNLAVARIHLGRATRALEALDHVSQMSDAEVSTTQRAHAGEIHEQAQAMLAELHVRVSPHAATLRLDGTATPQQGAERKLTLDPGSHVLALECEGYAAHEQTVEAEHGTQTTIELSLRRIAPPLMAASTIADSPATSPVVFPVDRAPAPTRDEHRSVWASPWLWAGVGAVAVTTVVLVLVAGADEHPMPANGGSLGVLHP